MKSIKYIFVLMVMAFVASVNAQDAVKPSKIYILDGYFFNEIPVDHSLLSGVMTIKTANGTSAYGLSIKEPLPDEAKKYAVQDNQIPEADILLEM